MKESEAKLVKIEIERLLQKYRVHYDVKEVHRPGVQDKPSLRFINFEEISIKVTK